MGQHLNPPADQRPEPSVEPSTAASRRTVLAGGALVAAGLVAASAPSVTAATGRLPAGTAGPGVLPDFTPVPAGDADALVVPEGFRADPVARWGEPLTTSAPPWRPGRIAAATEQAHQVGSHHHGVAFLPAAPGGDGRPHGLLVLAHESADAALTRGAPRTAMTAQGVTVVAVAAGRTAADAWRTVDSRANRRITAHTPVRLSGPAAGRTPARGVLAPGAVDVTPWGTVLVAEENANAFFGTDDRSWRRSEGDVRHGFSADGFGHPWHTEDPRFDLADRRSHPEHYGWIVEVDARDPAAEPVKRTALGRFAHGSATVSEAAGRIVVHSTDAEDGEYAYRFVGSAPWRELRAAGRDPLDHGTLHVARFAADGTGSWLPLTYGQGPLTSENGWRDQGDVLLRARLAADALGATPLARPERVAVDPRDGDVYLALVGGDGGTVCGGEVCAAGAPGTGAHGEILRWRGADGDPTAVEFRWERFLAGGARDAAPEGAFAHPKGLWFDGEGRLWISTGIPGRHLGGPDGPYRSLGNNALLAADPRTGTVRRFLTAPRGAEVTGVAASADGRTLFVNVQHPGQRTSAWGAPTADDPGAVSTWPDGRGSRPRSATVAIRRTGPRNG
ncbi:PhoX family protein [Streptomyces sp. NPDC127068]|uniref:PhoX family protein n=1 Tax=Streptomyces sp. NPDC127068 TaxID=3347127 RepID=UPI00364CCD1D